MDTSALGQQLREARIAAGLTMRELAAKAGLSHQLVEKLENGGSVRLDSIERLAKAAGAKLVIRIERATSEAPVSIPPPDRLAVASRLLAVLPRMPDRAVDVLLHEVALWEAEHSPQREQH